MSPGTTPLRVAPISTLRVTSHVTARRTRFAVDERWDEGGSTRASRVDIVTVLPTICEFSG
jgi:hypothetical protein